MVEQPCIEKIRRQTSCLRLEFSEAQYFLLYGKTNEILAEIGLHVLSSGLRMRLIYKC